MPGFIDVTGWTGEEVRRLGHADEDDNDPTVIAHNRRYARGRYTRPAQPVISYSVDTVWGAAARAHRINNGYFKDGVWEVCPSTGHNKRVKEPNRDLVKLALADQSLITEEDRKVGIEACGFIANQLTLKALKGKTSEFDLSMSKVVTRTEFNSNDRLEIALVASQIRAYKQSLADIAVADRIDHSLGYLADVGEKVDAEVEVTKSVWSQKYGVNFISGITKTNQAVFFSYREKFDAGTWISIKGTVKAHRPDATQLSRVKVL